LDAVELLAPEFFFRDVVLGMRIPEPPLLRIPERIELVATREFVACSGACSARMR
jgi:hypothetical protein